MLYMIVLLTNCFMTRTLSVNKPSIILVRPQLPENIGMVARAMDNFGLNKLILVSPREKWPNKISIKSSANSHRIIKGVKIYKNLKSVLGNFDLVIATSNRKRFLNKPSIKNFDNIFDIFPKNKKICIMHCTLCYPTKVQDANLGALKDLKENFKYLLGLSDHTLGTLVPSASVLYGVRAIEKHFTYDKSLKKSADHAISLNEKELKKLRLETDELLSSIGKNKKIVLNCETKTRKFARRSIVIKDDLKKGHILKTNDLVAKRPGTGISPTKIKNILGKRIKRNLLKDTIITYNDIS